MILQTIHHNLLLQNDVSHGIRQCNVVFTYERSKKICVNICDTVLLMVGIIQCNGGKLEDAEDFNCVLESK